MTSRRTARIALATVATIILTACSSSESASPTTTEPAPPSSTDPAAAADTDDGATPDGTTPPSSAPATAPPSTAPATTAPPATAAPTTAPPATTPPPPDLDLSQFCFESEQAYLANMITNELTEPTPEQAEASLQFLVFAAEQSVDAAPPGFGEEATRFLEIARTFDELFGRYDYDVDQLSANEDPADFEALFVEFEAIVDDDLIPFLEEACGSERAVLDDQATKIAPVIGDASTWPLVAVANQAGDIRLLVPTDWTELTGSAEIDEVTFLQATPDTEGFEGTWNVPGVFVTVFYIEAGVAEPSLRARNSVAATDCAPIGSQPYEDALYLGELFLYQACAGTDTGAAVLAVTNGDSSIEVLAEFQFPGGIDRDLLDQILATFVAGA